MTAPNKARGNQFEREIVQEAEALGLEAERAWGSDGRAMGEHHTVDVKVEGMLGQCKRRKKPWPKWVYQNLLPDENVDFHAVRCDYEKPFIILRSSDYFAMLKKIKQQGG